MGVVMWGEPRAVSPREILRRIEEYLEKPRPTRPPKTVLVSPWLFDWMREHAPDFNGNMSELDRWS